MSTCPLKMEKSSASFVNGTLLPMQRWCTRASASTKSAFAARSKKDLRSLDSHPLGGVGSLRSTQSASRLSLFCFCIRSTTCVSLSQATTYLLCTEAMAENSPVLAPRSRQRDGAVSDKADVTNFFLV